MSGAGGTMILGAGGLLGPHLVRAALAARPVPVLGVRRSTDPIPGVGHPEGLELRAMDARREGAAERLLDRESPRVVVLAAALSRVADCERDPEGAEILNAELPERVARWCAAEGARLVFVSTDLVFGGRAPRGERYAEEDPPCPLHDYGRTKAEGEERVLRSAPEALVARLPLLYGDSAGRGLGASDSILAAVARGERPRLFRDEWRTPLDVTDAARAIVEAALTPLRGLLHLAGPRRLSRLELGLEVLRARDRGLATEKAVVSGTRAEAGLAEIRAADVSLDSSRALRLLKTRLPPPEEALRRDAT